MTDSRFRIPSQPDKRVVERMRAIAAALIEKPPHAKTLSLTPYVGNQFAVGVVHPDPAEAGLFQDSPTYRLRQVHLEHQNRISVTWLRGGEDGGLPFQDDIKVSSPGDLKGEEAVAVAREIERFRDPLPGDPERESPREYIAAQMASILRLQQVLEELTVSSQRKHDELDEQLRSRHKESMERMDREHAARIDELGTRQLALDERERQIDVRGNTIARRQLHQDMIKEVKARQLSFKLTPETGRKRWSIHAACITTGVALLALAVYGASSSVEGVPAYVLFLTPIVGFVAILSYYVRWLNRWADRHSDAEFRVKQFALDIERANWLVESALEWYRETKQVLPEALVTNLSRRLFAAPDGVADEIPVHPAEQLASALLGRASKVKLRTGDSEMEFDQKGLKELARTPS